MFKLIRSTMIMSVLMLGFVNVQTASNAVQAAEVVYKWVDDNGVEHYSDKPFEDSKKTKVSLSGGKPPQEVSQAKPEKTNETFFDASDTQRVSQECENAKNNLAAFARGVRLLTKDSEGNNIEMDADEKAALQAKNQAFQDKYCKDVPAT